MTSSGRRFGDRPPFPEEIEARAAAWIAQRDDGLSAADAAEFARWRAADPRHEAAVGRLEATWSALAGLRDFRPEAVRHPDRDLLTPARSTGWSRSWVWPTAIAGVAAVALAVLVGLALPREPVAGEPDQVYATTRDGYQRVALPDGSSVELNASSRVEVQFTPETRRVRLVQGEAHFTVMKDRARPFVVDAGVLAVRAVGTAFNVRLGVRDIEVLVTEGRVAVAGGAVREEAVTPLEPATAPPVLAAELAMHDRLVVPVAVAAQEGSPAPAPRIERVSVDGVREYLAWQGPRLVFADTPLADALLQFNRRNPVQLELADEDLGVLLIGGSFRAENVDAFVRLLTAGGEIVAERPAPNRVVLRRGAGRSNPQP
jgi:transmembrane sensor